MSKTHSSFCQVSKTFVDNPAFNPSFRCSNTWIFKHLNKVFVCPVSRIMQNNYASAQDMITTSLTNYLCLSWGYIGLFMLFSMDVYSFFLLSFVAILPTFTLAELNYFVTCGSLKTLEFFWILNVWYQKIDIVLDHWFCNRSSFASLHFFCCNMLRRKFIRTYPFCAGKDRSYRWGTNFRVIALPGETV